MPPVITEFFRQVRTVFSRMSTAQKLTIGALVIAAFAGLLAVAFLSLRPDFSVAFRNLAAADASAVVEKIESLGIAHRLSADGATIEVPREDVARVRMAAAAGGLIRETSPGWELFDNLDVGLTDSLFAVKKQRAMEGELERDIQSLEPVERAHVTISLPRETVFTRAKERPTASVVLRLRPGWGIEPAQVAAIIEHLRTAVGQGMAREDVTVLDHTAQLLSQPQQDPASAPYESLLDRERGLEDHLTAKAESMLAATLGDRKFAVRVSVTLDRDDVEELEEKHDPESKTVIREKVNSTDRKDSPPAGGQTGTEAKIDGATEPPPRPGGSQTSEDVETEYALDTKTVKTKRPAGSITRLTVGMFIDETLNDKISAIEDVVKHAVGFDATRGDEIKTTALPFGVKEEPAPVGDEGPSELLLTVIRHGTEAVTVLAVLFLLRSLFLHRHPSRAGLPSTIARGPGPAAAPATASEPGQVRQEIAEAVEIEPAQAAQVLHSWLYEEVESSP
ncbi:MAG: flagellar basal-body MS-ring/collar protein FliF [Planctomycetota bacterium]